MKKTVWLVTLMLIASTLACNLPFMAQEPAGTPAPTDAGFAVPTEEGALPTEAGAPVFAPPVATQPSAPGGAVPAPAETRLTLATTDVLSNSGLLGLLIDDFSRRSGYQVKLELGGAGRAFRLGEKYVADVLLVNDAGTEKEFVASGNGRERVRIMHSDYVIVGPADDPAGIKGEAKASEALKKIAAKQARFITREQDSPTAALEARLWKQAGVAPTGGWFTPTKDGTLGVVKIAADSGGYLLVSRVHYLEAIAKGQEHGEILVEGDVDLLDNYHLVTVNPDKSPKVNYEGAQALLQYLLSPEAQAIIAAFGSDVYGEPIYFADGGK